MLKAAGRTILVLASLALVVPPTGAAPVCVDRIVGVNERCPAWTASYNHTGGADGNREDTAFWSAVSPDGSKVYVTGRSRDDATDRDAATIAVNASTGATLWTARYDFNGGYDNGSSVAATNSHVFVAGRSSGGATTWDWTTLAYDAATGQRLWTDRVAGEAEVDDTAWSVVASPDGRTAYVAGTIDDGIGIPGDALVIAYDAATGERRWEARHDSGEYDGGFRAFVSPDGSRVYLAGTTRAPNASMNYLALAIEAADPQHLGEILWTATYDSGQGSDDLRAATLSADGTRLVLTGQSLGADVNTVALDTSNGARLWSARYNGTRNATDEAGGVAIAAGRAVVVMKAAEGVAGFDIVTRAYDLATGAVAWTATEGTPATPDTGFAITALGPNVYVTGIVVVPRGEIQPIFKIEPGLLTTASYDAASGQRRWIAQHNQSGIGADAAVAISAGAGRVYPTGTFVFTGVYAYPVVQAKPYAWDYGVIAYDA